MEHINDGGYGVTGNMSMNILLNLLSEEDRQTYEEYLQKKDKVKYNQFKEWQEDFEKIKEQG